MFSTRTAVTLAGALAAVLAPFAAPADELAEKGRAVFNAHKEAVVMVQAILSLSYGGQDKEDTNLATGTVIDGSGLTVLSLTLVDPTALLESMGQEMPNEMTTKVVSLKILGANGDIPCEVVLRDKDLDLAFVRPVEPPAAPMTHVSLDNVGTPQLLDTLAIITELGEVARRAHSVLLERIETIVEKPRTYYVLGEHRAHDVLSSPAFTLDDKFVGIGAMRAIKASNKDERGENVLVTIIPAADIKVSAAQVPPVGTKIEEPKKEQKPVEKKTEPGQSDSVTLDKSGA